jgi:predicted Zn-dependent peptidase
MTDGPVVLIDTIPGASTAAVGVWVRSGSAMEPPQQSGITHLLEHLLLRRCGDRDPSAIAELIDSLGGAIDAFTTRELCAVTAHVPADRLAEATELVLDAAFHPRLVASEVELERRVVGAEFDLIQDSPAEVAAEHALAACWGDHPMARPVLGRREVVERLRKTEIERFHRQVFHAGNVLLAAVGPPGIEPLIESCRQRMPAGRTAPTPLSATSWHGGVIVEEREGLEQVYVNLVLPGLPAHHPDLICLAVLHQLLGAGASSRLFRELRDTRGLVYEVGTSIYATAVGGVLDVTFSAPVRQVEECWHALFEVLSGVARGDIGEREIDLAKQALGSARNCLPVAGASRPRRCGASSLPSRLTASVRSPTRSFVSSWSPGRCADRATASGYQEP